MRTFEINDNIIGVYLNTIERCRIVSIVIFVIYRHNRHLAVPFTHDNYKCGFDEIVHMHVDFEYQYVSPLPFKTILFDIFLIFRYSAGLDPYIIIIIAGHTVTWTI